MHMSDALLSPAVGGVMWAATAAATVYCSKKVGEEMDDRKIPLMGVLGAFIFAAQMINFTIPGTGSSGHLGGGLILAILLGPYAAFLVMASVLTVQALFFADGGLLALGANIFNLGVFPCFIAYPLIYRPIAGRRPASGRITAGSMFAAVIGLQLGSLGVVLQTVLSGVSELSFSSFALVMQPIHLGIGIVEGMVTAAVVSFVYRAQPYLVTPDHVNNPPGTFAIRKVVVSLAIAAFITGGGLSWLASSDPDGLEWSIARVTGAEETREGKGEIHDLLGGLQEKTAILPDYGFKSSPDKSADKEKVGTSISGIIGGLLTILLVAGIGWALRSREPVLKQVGEEMER